MNEVERVRFFLHDEARPQAWMPSRVQSQPLLGYDFDGTPIRLRDVVLGALAMVAVAVAMVVLILASG